MSSRILFPLHHIGVTLLAAICLLTVSGCGAGDSRTYWQHSRGYFVMLADKQWMEQAPDGRFQFQEVGRTPDFVELNDPTRGVRVRLWAAHCELANTGARIYNGGWERRP